MSSLDYNLSVFNLHPESGLTHYKDMNKQGDLLDVWKIDFKPNGNEIMAGVFSLRLLDVSSGEVIKEFNKGSKFIQSLAYVSGIRSNNVLVKQWTAVCSWNY